MTDHILRLLTRELNTFVAEIEAFPNDDLLWTRPPGITNSAGNLALHIAGNLRHFIGHVLGGTGYVRDREAEFGTSSGTREEVVAHLQAAIGMLQTVLPGTSRATLDATFPEKIAGSVLSTHMFLLHLCSHTALHLGQAGYLRRLLTGQNVSVGVTSVPAIAD